MSEQKFLVQGVQKKGLLFMLLARSDYIPVLNLMSAELGVFLEDLFLE